MNIKKIVLLLLITIGIASTAISQENLTKEKVDSSCYSYQDTKVIAQTFNENNYLKERVDSLESLQTVYKDDIDYYKQKDTILQYKINLMDGVVITQSTSIKKLSESYNSLLKESNKSKIFNGVLIGGIAISLGFTLFSIFKH